MANRIKGITIEIGGNTDKLQNALKGVNKSINETKLALRDVDNLLKLDPKNTELLKQKQELLTKEINDTKEKLEMEKEALAQLASQDSTPEVTQQMQNLQREIVSTEQYLKGAEKELKGFGGVGSQQLRQFGEELKSVGGKITEVGKNLSVVSAGITAVGVASVAAFNEVDEGFDVIIKKTGASGTALEEMNKIAEDIATSLPTDFNTIGEAVGEVNTRFGATGDELKDLSEAFIKFADLNNTDVSNSIDTVQNALNAFGLNTKDASKLLDVMNKVAQDTGVSVDTLSSTLVSNAAALQEMGMDAYQSAEFMGRVAKSGADTESVLSGLKRALKSATEEGKPLDEALQELQNTIENGNGSIDGLTAAYDLFGKSGAGIYTAVKNGSLSFTDLANSADLVNESIGSVNDTYNSTLDGIDSFTTANNALKLALADLGAVIGETLAPIMESLAEHIQTIKEKFDELDPSTQKAIVVVGMIIAAVGPLLVIIGTVITSVANIIIVISMLLPVLSALGAIIMGTVIPAVLAFVVANLPIILIIAAIAAAIALVIVVIQNWGEISAWIQEKWTAAMDALSAKWEEFKEKASEIFTNIKDTITGVFTNIYDNAPEWAQNLIDNYLENITGAIDLVKEEFEILTNDGIVAVFEDLRDKAFNWGKDMIQNFIDGLQSMIGALIGAVSGIAQTVASFLHFSKPDVGPLSDADKWMPDMVDLLSSTLNASVKNMKPALNNLAGTISNGVNTTSVQSVSVDTSGIYEAIRAGASDATIQLTIGNREFSRALKGMGVSFG